MDLCNKTVLITGAAGGLGEAMAIELAARGAKLALVDLDKAKLEPVLTQCIDLGSYVKSYETNVAQEEEVISLFKKVVHDFKGLDVLINNAGILRDGLLVKGTKEKITHRMSLKEWQAVIDVNLTGVFLCGREAAAHMVTLGSGGCIINISSISRKGGFGQSNYSASKAGVAALTVAWAQELAKHDIRVNTIAPGLVKTEMTNSIKPDFLEKIAASIPAERLCKPEEIAHAAIYLLQNNYMNGRIIEIDGGLRW